MGLRSTLLPVGLASHGKRAWQKNPRFRKPVHAPQGPSCLRQRRKQFRGVTQCHSDTGARWPGLEAWLPDSQGTGRDMLPDVPPRRLGTRAVGEARTEVILLVSVHAQERGVQFSFTGVKGSGFRCRQSWISILVLPFTTASLELRSQLYRCVPQSLYLLNGDHSKSCFVRWGELNETRHSGSFAQCLLRGRCSVSSSRHSRHPLALTSLLKSVCS